MAYVSKGLTVTFGSFNGEVVDINISNPTVETEDITHQGSTDGFREYLASFADGGDVSLTCLFDETKTWPTLGESNTLEVDHASWSLKFQATAICTGVGGISAGLGSRITRDVTFKITGKPDWVTKV